MSQTFMIISWCIGICIGILLSSSIAYQFGKKNPPSTQPSSESAGAVTGALFALLGLLLAFTFSGAYARYDARRQLIVQEVNSIGTAYLRLDLLPQESQPSLREDFRKYTKSRALFYEKLQQGRQEVRAELAHTTELQQTLWSKAITASSGAENQSARMLLIPALNEMIDIVTTRLVAIQTHPPLLIFLALAIIACACAGMTNYRASISGESPLFYNLMFSIIIALTVYLILDIEYPRFGFIRLDEFNQLFTNLAESMK